MPFKPQKPGSRKSQAISVGDGIRELLKVYQLETKFDETGVLVHWEKIMGKTIASRTEKIYIKDKRLFVKLSSSSLKQDLILSKQKIIDLLNLEVKQNVVIDVIFL